MTAGNASGINDGAAAVIMMSAKKAQELGLEAARAHRAYSSAGVDPKIMGMGPVPASQAVPVEGRLERERSRPDGNQRGVRRAGDRGQRKWAGTPTKINVNGGAIAIGHPIGASGCRILVTLLHEMIRRDAKKGLASLCIGGGMGVALAVER